MLTPTEKGNIAEAKLATAAIELGIGVCLPMGDGCRYDLIFDFGTELMRVQCKWAPRKGDVIPARFRTCRYAPGRGYVRTVYTADEVDALGLYCPQLDRCYLLPIADFPTQVFAHLRLAPARNNQREGVRMAAQYELGAIAQLGERRHGMAEVVGSSPTSSTATAAYPGGRRVKGGAGD